MNFTEQEQKYLYHVIGGICIKLAIAAAERPCCIIPAIASHYTYYSQVMFVIRKYIQLNIYGQVGEAGMALPA